MHFHFDKAVADKIVWAVFALAAVVFAASYAFGQYIRYKESNIAALDAWMNCVRTEQFSDKAYEFCRSKCSENYIFKKPFDWGDGRFGRDGDE